MADQEKKTNNDNWLKNNIQFARLLSEFYANVEFTIKQRKDVCDSMDLEWDKVTEIMERAGDEWQKIKNHSSEFAKISVEVEFDQNYSGGNYSNVGSFVTLSIDNASESDLQELVHSQFKSDTGLDPIHIVNWRVEEDDECDHEFDSDAQISENNGVYIILDVGCRKCGASGSLNIDTDEVNW